MSAAYFHLDSVTKPFFRSSGRNIIVLCLQRHEEWCLSYYPTMSESKKKHCHKIMAGDAVRAKNLDEMNMNPK